MIRTLLKHEAIRTRGMLLAIGGVAAAMGAVGAILGWTGWPVIAHFGMFIGFAGAIALVPALQLAQGIDYWRSSYGRVGYFTQTLPVRGSRTYWAKLLWALVVLLLAVVLAIGIGFVALLGSAGPLGIDAGALPSMIVDFFADVIATAPWWVVAGVPLLLLAMLALNTVMLFCAASVGSEQRMHPLGWGGPVLVWIALYIAMQVAMFVMILAVPFGLTIDDAGGFGVVGVDLLGAMVRGTGVQLVPLGFVPALLLIIPPMLWRTARSWERKVSLA